MLVINQQDIIKHLNRKFAVELMAQGFAAELQSEFETPPRQIFAPSGGGAMMGMMPSAHAHFMGIKVATVTSANAKSSLDCHQGCYLLFERSTGKILAVADATELTARRTAATSALAVMTLRKATSSKVAILGSGVQALHHIATFAETLQVRDFVLVTRQPIAIQEFQKYCGDVSIECRTYDDDLNDCPVIVTVTHAKAPILFRKQISSSALIVAVGASLSNAQEIANDVLDECDFVMDQRQACMLGCGEALYLAQRHSKHFGDELASRIGHHNHHQQDRLTVFKSVGLGFEDLVCAIALYEKIKTGTPTASIENFGGFRANHTA